jgi:uracil-DNA glycosylase
MQNEIVGLEIARQESWRQPAKLDRRPGTCDPNPMSPLAALQQEVIACRKCPRLVAWREEVARTKRRAYLDWSYWGKPVPSFGDPRAKLVIVGLAPAAHGANRTGRMFTGDRSGDFLFAALFRADFANQPTSTREGDGLLLRDAYIVAPVRCAPPANKPTPKEIANCAPFLERELELLRPKVTLALGAIAWNALLDHHAAMGRKVPRPRPKFGHGATAELPGAPLLLGSYHVSQQNTQTGKLTQAMFDAVLAQARRAMLAR